MREYIADRTSQSRVTPALSRTMVLMLFILLAASAFRFVGLDNIPTPRGATPPGLEHDEVAHWLINQDILAGEHAVYFTEAYGHEALYHYLQAGFGALVGDHALALRLPSSYFGILLVAVVYIVGRRMFGRNVGLWSAAFLAVLFWSVFYSRLALRAISLPFFSGMALYFWWRAFNWTKRELEQRKQPGDASLSHQHITFYFVVAGLFAGLSLHTYMAGRAVPIFFGLYTAYLFLFHRSHFTRHWRGILFFWLALGLVASPLLVFLSANPDAEVRISEVDAPLRALRAGDFQLVLENIIKISGMFGIRGDPLWRQNIAGRPVFDPVMAILFYAGVVLSLWRWRDPRHGLIILWLATAVLPSVVTIDAPSSIRIINLLPVLMLFPLVLIHTAPHLSTFRDKFSTELTTRLVNVGLSLLLAYSALSTVTGLWRIWPADDEVRFVWQAALTEAAAYLDHSNGLGSVAIGGWTPETMDPPTMELTLRRDDLSMRYFDPTQSLIIPYPFEGRPIQIVRPTILPLVSPLQDLIGKWEQPQGEFTVYNLPALPPLEPQHAANLDFGGRLNFLGYDMVAGCQPGQPCSLVTYWQVMTAMDEPLRMFLHAAVNTGEIVSQDDRLGAPAEYWQVGDIVVQILTVEEATQELRVGVYNPQSGQRLITGSGGDYETIDVAGGSD